MNGGGQTTNHTQVESEYICNESTYGLSFIFYFSFNETLNKTLTEVIVCLSRTLIHIELADT